MARGLRLRDYPGFLSLWGASTVSELGSYVTTLAIQLLVVVNLEGRATEVGLVNGARWLPYLLFGLVAGVIVDRCRRKPLLVVTDFARGLLLIAVPVLALAHDLSLALLAGFMALFGLMSLLGDAAFQAFVPRLLPRDALTAGHARLDQGAAVAQTSGPALAGGLVSAAGAPWAVLVDAASYLVSGLLVLRISVSEPPTRAMSLRGIPSEAAEGLRWVYRHATLRPLALTTHAWFLCSGIASAVLVPFAIRVLHLSAAGIGVALALTGAGGLIGSLRATQLGSRFGAGHVVIACRAGTAFSYALLALSGSHGFLLFGCGQLLLGLSLGMENPNEMGYRQAVTPDHLQGRMNATMRSINRAMLVIGAPLGGVLGDRYGYRPMLWVVAVGFLLVAGVLACSGFRSARIDDAVPA